MYLYRTSNIKHGQKPKSRNTFPNVGGHRLKFSCLIIEHMLSYLFFAAPIIDTTSNTFDRR